MVDPWFVVAVAGAFGLVIGSFLNVCTFRWPNEESVVSPPSHCPKCDEAVRWYDNIPVVSYLVLRGRCRWCKERISIQYPLVELATGAIIEVADPLSFDQRAEAADPRANFDIPASADIAGIGKRSRRAPAYLMRRNGKLKRIILPVRGSGYQSMLYGYLALEGDLVTVAGLTFYAQAETPGLGTRIQEPAWQNLWPGSKIADDQGNLRIEVVRGKGTRPYQVDGISGATRTGTGVTNLLRFWLGDYGFGPFLKQVETGKIDP